MGGRRGDKLSGRLCEKADRYIGSTIDIHILLSVFPTNGNLEVTMFTKPKGTCIRAVWLNPMVSTLFLSTCLHS